MRRIYRKHVMNGNSQPSTNNFMHSEMSRTKYIKRKNNLNAIDSKNVEFSICVSIQNIRSIIQLLTDFPEEKYPLFVVDIDGTVSITIEFYNKYGVSKFILPKQFWTIEIPKIEESIRFAVSLLDMRSFLSSNLNKNIDDNGVVELKLSKKSLILIDHETSQQYMANCKYGDYIKKVLTPLDPNIIMNNGEMCKLIIPYEVFREELLFNIKDLKIKGDTVVLMFEPNGIVSFYYPHAPWFNQNLYYAYKTPPKWWGKSENAYVLTELSLDLLIRSVKNKDNPEFTAIVLYLDNKMNLMVTYTMDNIDCQYTLFSISNRRVSIQSK